MEDLQDIAAIDSGKLLLVMQKTDIQQLVMQNANLNRVLSAKKNIHIQIVTSGPILRVKIDVNKIEQVMNYLISNAIKYSMPGTFIQIHISVDNGFIIVAVTDQGQGIPHDEIEKLLKPFQRTSVRTTEGEKSSGLGLSILQDIVMGHGINI